MLEPTDGAASTMPCSHEQCRVATEVDEINVREGLYAQSRKDFISKLSIALKEAGETDYWLDIIHTATYFTDDEYLSLKNDNDELLKLLTSIIKSTREKTK